MKTKKIPTLQFKSEKSEWSWKYLKDISKKVTEKNKDNQYTETLTNSAELGIINQRDYFDKDISNQKNLNGYYIVRPDDFVYNPRISSFAPVGPIKRNKLGRTGVMSPLYYVFRTQNIDLQYLEFYFSSVKWHLYMKQNGDSGARSDRFAIKDIVFGEMPIPYPSKDIQRKIGSFFKDLDDLISRHQQELDALKQTKQGFLQKMFPREGQLIPMIRFNEFKDNWTKKLLEQKGKLRSGIGFSEIEQGGTEGIPFYKVSDMNHRDNKMKMKIANNYVTDQQIKSKKWSVIEEVPAIIFAKVGAALMLNRKKLVTTSFLIDNNLMSYSFNSEWDSYFGYTLFQTIFLPKYAQVGALPSFNISDVSNIEILLPSYNEQVKIGKFFRQLDEVIELKEQELEALKQTKKGFLQKMFI